MSFLFIGPRGQIEQRWVVYAALRDCVQHHLERGSPSESFSALHSIAPALTGERVMIPAAKLHDELKRARVLLERPVSDLAISARTRSLISLKWPPSDVRETMLARDAKEVHPLLAAEPRSLGDVFGHLLEHLLSITDGAGADEKVTVTDL